MKEFFVQSNNLVKAYHSALDKLYTFGEYTDCQDWNTRQREISITIEVSDPLSEPMISKCFIGGPEELEQYRQEILDGILDFEVEKGNWTYTYHDRMVNYYVDTSEAMGCDLKLNQIDFVITELKRNPSSRRAVILIRDNSEDAYSDDPACLQHLQYFIRDNKLHCKVLFRSNDACKACFMNMFALILLQKKIADELGIEVGTYTHRANSFHVYEKDFDLLKSYINKIEDGYFSVTNLDYIQAYDYIGDWDELMEEAKPMIAKKVEELKNR